jgi:hypothetical protein
MHFKHRKKQKLVDSNIRDEPLWYISYIYKVCPEKNATHFLGPTRRFGELSVWD